MSLNPLAGKIMFRDFVYIDFDYSVRVQDGYFIFRWWRSYVPKDVSEGKLWFCCFDLQGFLLIFGQCLADLSHSDTRLSVQLNGFELHIYNRSDLYDQLEKTFGLKPSLLIPVRFLLRCNCWTLRRVEKAAMIFYVFTLPFTDRLLFE